MNHLKNGGDKKVRFVEKLSRFASWCESHGIFTILVDFVFKLLIWILTR